MNFEFRQFASIVPKITNIMDRSIAYSVDTELGHFVRAFWVVNAKEFPDDLAHAFEITFNICYDSCSCQIGDFVPWIQIGLPPHLFHEAIDSLRSCRNAEEVNSLPV